MSDYTIMRAAEAPDYTGDAPGAFLGYARPMDSEQLALNLRVLAPGAAHVPPGGDPTAGHRHRTIEEIYFVLYGEITIKLGDDVTTLGPRDTVRITAAERVWSPAGWPRRTATPSLSTRTAARRPRRSCGWSSWRCCSRRSSSW